MDRESSRASIPSDVLVEHAVFVRRIALAVLRNDADADDAAQDTLARGLTTGRANVAAHRPWLIAVVRNFARRLVRRESRLAEREHRASRREGTGSTVDAVARQEMLHAVAFAVDALDFPSREVVLLRHYDGLPVREIAARLGLPVETVKKRLSRAHDALRARLDAGDEHERTRRRSALGAFAGIEPGSKSIAVAATKGAVMAWSAKTIMAGAVAIAALGFGTWRWLGRDSVDDVTVGPAKEAATLAPPAVAPPELAAPGKAPAPPPSPVSESRPAGPKTPPWNVYARGRVRLMLPGTVVERSEPDFAFPELGKWVGPMDGASSATWEVVPRKDAEARLARLVGVSETVVTIDQRDARMSRGEEAVAGVTSRVQVIRLAPIDGAEETFSFVLSLPVDSTPVADESIALILSRIRLTRAPAAVLAAAGDVPGDVIEMAVFVDGVPLDGTVTVEPYGKVWVTKDDGRQETTRGPPRITAISAEGTARFDGLAAGNFDITVRGSTISLHRIFSRVTGRAQDVHPRLVLALGTYAVRGRAYARDGRPAIGAKVTMNPEFGVYGALRAVAETLVDAEGRYDLRGLPRLSGIVRLALPAIDGMPQAVREEHLYDASGTNPASLDLGDAHALPIWRGTVVDAGGRPVELPGELRLTHVEAKPGRPLGGDTASVRKDGKFEARVASGTYRVRGVLGGNDTSPRFLDEFQLEIPAIGLERDVVLKGGGTLVVRIQSGALATNAGVEIEVEPVGVPRTWSRSSTTGRKGTARFDDLPAGRYKISVADKTVTLVGGGKAEIEIKDSQLPVEVLVELHAPEGTPPPR